jgi:sugar diacid utilization regulator
MTVDTSVAKAGIDHPAELPSLDGVFILSSLMFDGRPANAVLELAAEAVQCLGKCSTEAAYRLVDGSLVHNSDPDRPLDSALDAAVAASVGVDHEVVLTDSNWRYAITLRTTDTVTGVLVVRAQDPASCHELVLLKAIAQQAAAAMASADVIERERRQHIQLKELTDRHEKTIHRLSRSVAELERRDHIHKALTDLSGSADAAAIADALHDLTSLTVSVEDTFGNLRAWSPAPTPTAYRAVGGGNREDVIRNARSQGHHSDCGNRIFSLIRAKADFLGVVVLHDPQRRADRLDIFALEYAAAVLAVEFSHQRSLAETEGRLSRDLVDDLLAGTDNATAYARGEALGYNLRRPHRVTVLQWSPEIDGALIARSATRWATSAGLRPLCARRQSMTILLTEDLPEPRSLYRAISAVVGNGRGWIAIGSAAATPSELPRSFAEARRTLRMQQASVGRHGFRRFDDLGVCRILDPSDNSPEVREFLTEWLGPLMTYDQEKNAELVNTLARYLDSGGNYDHTARALNIHRSTLRYRLGRIRDISGHDLQNVETRLNLHLATKVSEMIGDTQPIIRAASTGERDPSDERLPK